ncbi:hypothetical protein, partial [Methylacidiphilum sp. Yel]|uniref:hypothetical protein n=1 Tax=Methylacidiphilum sp. Yel TaxID=1847730 RepID=UPI001ABC33CB
FLLDFNCSFLFIHNYTTHSYNLSPYIPMPEGRGITAMDGKLFILFYVFREIFFCSYSSLG